MIGISPESLEGPWVPHYYPLVVLQLYDTQKSNTMDIMVSLLQENVPRQHYSYLHI